MSTDEDTELRDLVASTLETNGVLNKIRAELRANVFLALEEHNALEDIKTKNMKLEKFLDSKEGVLVFSLVRECLEYFNLDFTLAVLDPESNFSGKYLKKDALKREFNLHSDIRTGPLLLEILKVMKMSKVTTTRGGGLDKESDDLGSEPLTIDKDSLQGFQRVRSFPRGSVDGDDDILADFGRPEQKKKPAARMDIVEKSAKPSNDFDDGGKPSSTLGSLKDAPPLPGLKDSKANTKRPDNKSQDWNDLAAIEEKINRLGFEIPKDDFDYEEDFQGSSKKSEGELSITEEIEEDISIGSFADSKAEDGLTTDQTVSHISGTGLDYGEDIEL